MRSKEAGRLFGVLWFLTGWMAGCAPELAGIQERSAVPRPEQDEIVPVGGYQLLSGTWETTRSDEAIGEQRVALMIEVDKDVLSGSAPDSSVRVRCQASHRTCLGTWSDNVGHGRVTLTFGTDFQSFTGTYDGTSQGMDVGRSTWIGKRM
jgi:hypothetical protein